MATILGLLESDSLLPFIVLYPSDDIKEEEASLQAELPHLLPLVRIEKFLNLAYGYKDYTDFNNQQRLTFQAHSEYLRSFSIGELQGILLFDIEFQLSIALIDISEFELCTEYLDRAERSARTIEFAPQRVQALAQLTEFYLNLDNLEKAKEMALLSPMPTQFRDVIGGFGSLFAVCRAYLKKNDICSAQELLEEIRMRASNASDAIREEILGAAAELENAILVQQLGQMALRV